MNAQPLLGFVAEQHLAVTSAEQEREPVEIGAKCNRVVGAVAHEAASESLNRSSSVASQSCRNCSISASSVASLASRFTVRVTGSTRSG